MLKVHHIENNKTCSGFSRFTKSNSASSFNSAKNEISFDSLNNNKIRSDNESGEEKGNGHS
jgi:hypothetical protein